jgi:predicted RNA-binding Zn-ribbon protein involved in translation (DUF1610 family)
MYPSDSEAALGMKFLEVCQELTNKGIPFTCTLSIGSTLNLSLDTRGKEKKQESTSPLGRKKTSPSTTRRNARRKALYLEKKEEKSKAAENTTAATKSTYKDLEDKDSRRITTTTNLKKKNPAQVEHPPEKLPQLDGEEDGITNDCNVDDSESEEFMEKEITFKCEDCDYKTKEEQYLLKHAEKLHYQCPKCGETLYSRSSLKVHRKEKHCNNCGKTVNSYWHRKHMKRGDIYNVCGPDCYVEFYKTIVNFAPPPEFSYSCADSAKWFWG